MSETSETITLNGHLLSTWQSCRRKYAIEQQYRYRRWHPTALLSSSLRRAVFSLSNGADVAKVTTDAVNYLLTNAKQPGFDIAAGVNTYTLAMDLAATIRTVLEYLSRLTLLSLRPSRTIAATDNVDWTLLSNEDESGVLHRWRFVDYINEDTIMREMHSWSVIGDIAVAQAPMMLHFVSIGQTQSSRRITPWARAFKSPVIAGLYRFKRRTGSELRGDWKPIWFSDNPKNSASDWVDMMLEDDVTDGLVRHIQVREPDAQHIKGFYRDLEYEHKQISALESTGALTTPLTSLPITRPTCDMPYVCPHQQVCYSTKLTLDSSGLYSKIPRKGMEAVNVLG